MSAFWISGSALCMALALAACGEKDEKAEPPRPVRTVKVSASDFGEKITLTGEIQARYETDLAFRLNGRITGRRVDVGARLKPGDLVATMDDRDVVNEMRVAEADLASAKASAEAARAVYLRQKVLAEKHIVAQVSLESAEAQWRSAAAREKSTTAALASAQNKLNYTRLVATEPGVVTAVGANAGQVVGAGQMVARVASDGAKDAVFSVSEKLFLDASPDISVLVALTANPQIHVRGTVREISPSADPVTRTYRVRISLPNAPEAMSLGATVSGTAETKGARLITLPASAVTSRFGEPAVLVVDHGTSKLALKRIGVTRYAESGVLVNSGLAAGDEVVIAGVSKLRPDQIVKVAAEGEK